MTTFDFGVEFDVDNSVPVPALKKISEEDINTVISLLIRKLRLQFTSFDFFN